jgi:hypothetical protein
VIRVSATWPSLSLATAALARSGVVGCYDAAGGQAGAGRSSPGGVAPHATVATAGEVFPRWRLAGRAGTTPPCYPGRRLGAGEYHLLLPCLPLLRPQSLATPAMIDRAKLTGSVL